MKLTQRLMSPAGALRVAAIFITVTFQHHCGSTNTLHAAPADARKSIAGTVTNFKIDSLELGVKPDKGAPVFVKIGSETEVVQAPPGETDLRKAKPVKVTDIARGDRILVSFVEGLTEARRIVLISATDIAVRNENERRDWQTRGVSGIVASKATGEITLERRTPQGAETLTLTVTPKTIVRRYAPDSVIFADAQPSTVGEIGVGDQVRARGAKSEDGKKIAAEDIVFGTFLTKVGPITALRLETHEMVIQDSATQQPLTIRLPANTQLKALPDMRKMLAAMLTGGRGAHTETAPAPPPQAFDMAKMLEQLPAATLDDLKTGSTVIVSSTSGSKPGEVTAIRVIANADGFIQFAQKQTGGDASASPLEAMSRMHGGALAGPGGLSLPAIIP